MCLPLLPVRSALSARARRAFDQCAPRIYQDVRRLLPPFPAPSTGTSRIVCRCSSRLLPVPSALSTGVLRAFYRCPQRSLPVPPGVSTGAPALCYRALRVICAYAAPRLPGQCPLLPGRFSLLSPTPGSSRLLEELRHPGVRLSDH